nr:hypothetical protein CFP56_34163 [Quercus suber]
MWKFSKDDDFSSAYALAEPADTNDQAFTAPAYFSSSIRVARVRILGPPTRVGSRGLLNGGAESRPRGIDRGGQVWMGSDSFRVGSNGGSESFRVGAFGFVRVGIGRNCYGSREDHGRSGFVVIDIDGYEGSG